MLMFLNVIYVGRVIYIYEMIDKLQWILAIVANWCQNPHGDLLFHCVYNFQKQITVGTTP